MRGRTTVGAAVGAMALAAAGAPAASAGYGAAKVGESHTVRAAGGAVLVEADARWDPGSLRARGRHRGAVTVVVFRTRARRDVVHRSSAVLALRRGTRFTEHAFRLTGAAARAARRDRALVSVRAVQQSNLDGDRFYDRAIVGEAAPDCQDLGPNADLEGCDLDGAFLNGMDLAQATLAFANIAGADAVGTNFLYVVAPALVMPGVSAQRSNWGGAVLASAQAEDTNFTGAFLENVTFNSANLGSATLTGASLSGAVCFKTTWIDQSVVQPSSPGPCPNA